MDMGGGCPPTGLGVKGVGSGGGLTCWRADTWYFGTYLGLRLGRGFILWGEGWGVAQFEKAWQHF